MQDGSRRLGAASRVPIVCGMSMTLDAAVVISSANAPERVIPIIVRLAQRLSRPCLQYSQAPQTISGLTVTCRPAPGPSRISPASSCPRISGGGRRGSRP